MRIPTRERESVKSSMSGSQLRSSTRKFCTLPESKTDQRYPTEAHHVGTQGPDRSGPKVVAFSGPHNRRDCLLDPQKLRRRGHTAKQTRKVSVLYAGDNVLPAICTQQAGLEDFLLLRAEAPPGNRQEVVRIRSGLRLKNAVNSSKQGDKVVHAAIALGGVQACVLGSPFELVELHMLALVLPMIVEYILEQRAQLLSRRDALIVVRLHEQLDVAGECKD